MGLTTHLVVASFSFPPTFPIWRKMCHSH